jgi:hypothetical protein
MNLITNNYGGGNPICVSPCSATTGSFVANTITPSYNADSSYSSTSNTALRSFNPFARTVSVINAAGAGPMFYGASTWMYFPWYSNITYPYSGSPLTIIPFLSATTCDFGGTDGFYKIKGGSSSLWPGSVNCESDAWGPRPMPVTGTDPNLLINPTLISFTEFTRYTVHRTDINDPRSFDLYVGDFNPGYIGFWNGNCAVLIYRQVGANPPIILDPNYFV